MPKKTLGFCALCVATPAVAATTCDPGYYLENGKCHDCGSGYYCTGGTEPRRACLDVVPADAPVPGEVFSLSTIDGWADYEHCSDAEHCWCHWFFSDETRTMYFNEIECSAGPTGTQYTRYSWCRTGYYATNPQGWGNWYGGPCSPCTNAPAHAHYTSYSTPSVMYAVESNCPWECDDGYGRVGDTCAPLCTAGITHIRAGTTAVPLFPTRRTTPSLVVQTAGGTCYGNLTTGNGPGINIRVDGTNYRVE